MLFQDHPGCHSTSPAPPPLQLRALPPYPHGLPAGVPTFSPLQHHCATIPCPSTKTAFPREHAASCAQLPFSVQTAKEVGHRSMTRASLKEAVPASAPAPAPALAPAPARQITLPVPPYERVNPFTFTPLPRPEMPLTFLPRPPSSRASKRCRATADIDGDHSCLYKKKRRLRLFLITSRLSPEFSHPATNIVDRGLSKIAVWAKQRALGRNLLRKAAILNRIRRTAISAKETEGGLGRVLVEQEKEQEQLEMAKSAFNYDTPETYARPGLPQAPPSPPSIAARAGNHLRVSRSPSSTSRSPSPTPLSPPLRPIGEGPSSEYQSPNDAYSYSPPRNQTPRKSFLPLPPSPLGLSNYDAFDLEDDIPDPYAHLDEEYDEPLGYPDDEMENGPTSPSTTTSASLATHSTAETATTQIVKTPPQTIYSDFSVLDPGEPVFGDYDQVEEGADAVWPSSFVQDHPDTSHSPLSSTSPDFQALFATVKETYTSVSPNFQPLDGQSSTSPNFTPRNNVSTSPNFTPREYISTSPTFTPRAAAPISPNIAPYNPPGSTSPNFAPFPQPSKPCTDDSNSPSKTRRGRNIATQR